MLWCALSHGVLPHRTGKSAWSTSSDPGGQFTRMVCHAQYGDERLWPAQPPPE